MHVELGTRPRCSTRAPQAFGARAEHLRHAGVPRPARVRCRCVNGTAVEYAIRIGLALNCQIAETCRFARKNYFYPDVPKNFQTSQYDEPIAFDGLPRRRARRRHASSASRSSARTWRRTPARTPTSAAPTGRIHGAEYSLVDYNRAGIPLVEIVTQPITGAGDARARGRPRLRADAARHLPRARGLRGADGARQRPRRRQRLAAPDARVAAGHPHRDQERQLVPVGRARRALRGRRARPAILDDGGTVIQETRHWHEDTGVTTPGRVKSDAEDYRYFPEPDLVPVGAEPRVGRGDPRDAARAARRAPSSAAGRVGLRRRRDARRRQRRRARPHRGDDRRGRDARPPRASGGWASSPAPPSSRGRARRPAGHAGADRRAAGARRRRPDQRQARPPGARGRARRRGLARGGRRRARPGASCPTTAPCWQPSTTRWPRSPTSPRRSAAATSGPVGAIIGARHEGDPRAGRRRPGARADPVPAGRRGLMAARRRVSDKPTLEGELVRLRPLEPRDADGMWELGHRPAEPPRHRDPGDVHARADRAVVRRRPQGGRSRRPGGHRGRRRRVPRRDRAERHRRAQRLGEPAAGAAPGQPGPRLRDRGDRARARARVRRATACTG